MFVESPSEGCLDQCTRDQLVKIAEYYRVDVGDEIDEETVKPKWKTSLFKMEVFGTAEATSKLD